MSNKSLFFIKKVALVVMVTFFLSTILTGCDLQNIFSNLGGNNTQNSIITVNAFSYYSGGVDILGGSGYITINNQPNTDGQEVINANLEQILTLNAVANEGFSFVGWYLHNPEVLVCEYPTFVVGVTQHLQENTTALMFYAHFTGGNNIVVTHTVQFYDGESLYHTIDVENAQTVILPTAPQKEHYEFMGWNTEANGQGIFLDESMQIETSYMLYAIWQAQTYTVTFDANGGILDAQNVFEIGYNSVLGSNMPTQAPIKNGYNFTGWKIDTSNESEFITGEYVVTQDVTLYATYAQSHYTLTYYALPDSEPIIKQVPAGQSIGQNMPYPPTREGYNFLSWSTNQTQLGNYVSQSTVPTSDMTIYALWSLKSYNIVFEGNGGKIDGSLSKAYTIPYNTSYGSFMQTPVRSGYSFIGWNTKADGTGETYNAQSVVLTGKTLYAVWGFEICSLTYNANGGVITSTNTFYVTANTVIGNSMPTNPTRTGYTFLGWATFINASSPNINSNTVVTTSMTLYAVWMSNQQ